MTSRRGPSSFGDVRSASLCPGTHLPGTGQALDGQAVANYIAKYATKTLTAPDLPSQRIGRDGDIEQLRCTAHYRRLITTAWQQGRYPPKMLQEIMGHTSITTTLDLYGLHLYPGGDGPLRRPARQCRRRHW